MRNEHAVREIANSGGGGLCLWGSGGMGKPAVL